MRYIFLLFLFSVGYATDYAPWFTPPFEFQGFGSYLFSHRERVQTPKGSFKNLSNDNTVQFSLGVTPWPYWNVETELYLTKTTNIPFSYQASLVTVRYAWLDDITGDLFSLVTGVTLSFPGDRYLRDFGFSYHGNINAEFHATVGKEWACQDVWITRLWFLGGLGQANRGSPWLHGLLVWDYAPLDCLQGGLFSDATYGLGNEDIIPNVPFEGYANINHQTVMMGGYLNYMINYVGALTLIGWVNLYSHNFVENYWGIQVSFLFPFSIL